MSLRKGWMIEDSGGGCHTSWHSAVEAYRDDPTLWFVELSLDMSGERRQTVTSEVRRRAVASGESGGK